MARDLPSLDHLFALSDDTGVIQHATDSVPNRSTGYCTDDVARAFIVAIDAVRANHDAQRAYRLASTCLSFLHDAQLEDGRFHNFMSYDRAWLDEVGTHDSCGRALWAIGYGMRFAPTPAWRRVCSRIFERGAQTIDWLSFARSEAYAIIGLTHAIAADGSPSYRKALVALAQRALERWHACSDERWRWFEDELTYDNGRLPEALLRAALSLRDVDLGTVGVTALGFLESVVFEAGMFVPIGNVGWYHRDGARARFAQQPLEAAAMVDAELAALALFGDVDRLHFADAAHQWFYGKNVLNVVMAHDGGCFDGLECDGPNRNMGAESTIAHLSSAFAVTQARRSSLRIAR